MEKGSKEGLMTSLGKKVNKTVASLALVTALNLTPISTEQKNDPNIGVPNTSTISLSLENKAYAEEEKNFSQMYLKLSTRYPGWFLEESLNDNSRNFIKKINNSYFATDTFSIIAEYKNNEWQRLEKQALLYPDNPKQRMIENLETLRSSIFTSNEGGTILKTKNPLGIIPEDIEEYKNSSEKNLTNISLITDKNNEDSLIIIKNKFSEKNLEVIKFAFEILKRDSNKLNHITSQQGLRAITSNYATIKITETDSLNYMIASRGVLCLNPKKIENPLDIYLALLYQSNASELWKSIEVTNGKKNNYLDNSGKKISIRKMELTKEYLNFNKNLFSENEFNYLMKELNRLTNLL